MDVQPIGVAILVGGQSSRMGRPKHDVPCGDLTMGESAVRLGRRISPLIVIAGPAGTMPPHDHIADTPEHAGRGPLAGIEAVLRSGLAHRWLILPCDMPALRVEDLQRLVSSPEPVCVFVDPLSADGVGLLHLPVAVDGSMADTISAALDAHCHSVGRWLSSVQAEAVASPPLESIHNVNSPTDLPGELDDDRGSPDR